MYHEIGKPNGSCLDWRTLMPKPPFIERRFTSLGLHFFQVSYDDVSYAGTLLDGYIICISTGLPCVVKHKSEHGEQSGHFLKGDINVTPPCEELVWELVGKGEFTCLYASKYYIEQVIASLGMAIEEPVVIKKEFQYRDRLIEGVFEAITEQFETNDYRDQIYVEAMARAIFIHLLHKSLRISPKLWNSYQRTFSYEQMERIRACILERLDERILSADLARCVHVSEYHFYRLFRRTTGMTPQQFIKNIRLERARHLVEHSSLSLSEVAYRTGFTDQSHLSREFRALFGISARKFRDRLLYAQNLELEFDGIKSSLILIFSSLMQDIPLELFDYLPLQLLV